MGRGGRQPPLQVDEPAFGAAPVDVAVDQGGDPCGVVAAILQSFQRFDEQGVTSAVPMMPPMEGDPGCWRVGELLLWGRSGGGRQYALVPRRTAGTVISRILMSSNSDQFVM